MINDLVAKPRKLSYGEIESMADNIVKTLAEKGMDYEHAYWVIDAHKEVFDETLSHLNHNAAIEMKKNPIKYVLG